MSVYCLSLCNNKKHILPYINKRVKPYITFSNIKVISDGLILAGNTNTYTKCVYSQLMLDGLITSAARNKFIISFWKC